MILGLVALVIFCVFYISLPCAIVGLILSILGKKKSKVTGTGGGMAMAGMILSIVALGLAILIFAVWGTAFMAAIGLAEKAVEEAQRQQQQSGGTSTAPAEQMLDWIRLRLF